MTNVEETGPSGRHARGGDEAQSGALIQVVANHWGLLVVYGAASAVLGIVLAVWPDETLVVCAVLVAIQLILSGVIRLTVAVAGRGVDGGMRAVIGISGALALIIGLLCLRHPVQTLLTVSVLLGVWWVFAGIVDVLSALLAPVPGRRGWDTATGLISIVAGGFLLIDPRLTLGVFVVVLCAWLIATGIVAIVAGLRLRSLAHSRTTTPSSTAGYTPGVRPIG